MQPTDILMLIGFLMVGYSVIGNDCVQTLGTFISSTRGRFHWGWLWFYIAALMMAVIWFGWLQGDMSYGRLAHIPAPDTFGLKYLIGPAILVILTLYGVPVSNTFLILSIFASQPVLELMLWKTLSGYLVAFVFSIAFWMLLHRYLPEFHSVNANKRRLWTVAQFITSGSLWAIWLVQNVVTIAVFLPRETDGATLVAASLFLLAMLAYILKTFGGRIQDIVNHKSGTDNVIAATTIDFFYALLLAFFTFISTIPMSTTWVFVGLLAGREVAVYNHYQKYRSWQHALPNLGYDLIKITVGLLVSLLAMWLINKFL